ncbi:lytic transglycosylase domain-containing protein [Rhodoligotrophos ferricapiens]|uniref:lytic transglycosylase domain-containing protein n=1 Tax=Rhodoligotrophos ferricapiens TaxID=3069264 RepID=UPI00315DA77A
MRTGLYIGVALVIGGLLASAGSGGAQQDPAVPPTSAALSPSQIPVPLDENALESPGKPPTPKPKLPAPALHQKTVCGLIETAASEHRLPIDFFTRLIWQESGFRADATSYVGAQGIAQFMPGTAAERGLEDPYDIHQAIPASAHLLRDLRARFGNLGLAAAAYNAGPRRVEDWLAGNGGLPYETRDYVLSITGRDAEDWAQADRSDRAVPDRYGSLDVKALAMEVPVVTKKVSCIEIAKTLTRGRPAVAGRPGVPVAKRRAPWGVQVAAHFSQSQALARFGQLQRRFKVLSGVEPMVVRELNRSRGKRAMFNVRLPADSRTEADRICDRFRNAGGACIVLRN